MLNGEKTGQSGRAERRDAPISGTRRRPPLPESGFLEGKPGQRLQRCAFLYTLGYIIGFKSGMSNSKK